MGPEGGVNGGKIIAEGTPEKVSTVKESYTGKFIKEIIGENPMKKTAWNWKLCYNGIMTNILQSLSKTIHLSLGIAIPRERWIVFESDCNIFVMIPL